MKQLSKYIGILSAAMLLFGSNTHAFSIDSSIDNALQIIQRILITTTGRSTDPVVIDINTGSNNIYVNTAYLPTTAPYGNEYVLTLNTNKYLGITSMKDFIQNTNFTLHGIRSFASGATIT